MEYSVIFMSDKPEKAETVFQLCIICQNEKKKHKLNKKALKAIEELAK